MHRYAWDMRYRDAHGIEGGTFLAGGNLRGPIAVPGTYQIRMKTGGHTFTQPLRIVADSKSEATAADLQEQFDLLIAIRDKVSAIHRFRRPDAGVRSQAEQPHGGVAGIRRTG